MKKSFILYTDYKQHISLLSTEQKSDLLDAIFSYADNGTYSSLDAVTEMAFSFIRSQMDRDNALYDEKIEKRKQAGRLGGVAKASNAKQSLAKASNAKQSLANLADTVNDNVNVNVNGININTPPLSPTGGDSTHNAEIAATDQHLPAETKAKVPAKRQRTRFEQPTPEEVQAYCNERSNGIVGVDFVDYYATRGWMLGKTQMKDWRAAVRTWERNGRQRGHPAQGALACGINGSNKPKANSVYQERLAENQEIARELLKSRGIDFYEQGTCALDSRKIIDV